MTLVMALRVTNTKALPPNAAQCGHQQRITTFLQVKSTR